MQSVIFIYAGLNTKIKSCFSSFFFLTLVFFVGCKKLVEVNTPITSMSSENVYFSDPTAAAVLTGIYTNMSNNGLNAGLSATSFFPGLSSDELTLYSGAGNATYTAYYTNALTNINTGISDFWSAIYPIIFVANSAIEGLTNNFALTPAVQKQLMGEAKFMRAFCYFYLVNLYGDVPLMTGTDYSVNALLPRAPKTLVWQQIIQDLTNAQSLLSTNYLDGTLINTTNERVRPTSWAATALLARAYLYTQKWDSAEAEATSVIKNTTLYSLDTLNGIFLANSTEAIWQLQPTSTGQNTPDGLTFIIPTSGPSGSWPVYLSNNLLSSFEVNDLRRVNWVDSVVSGGITYYYPFKYKVDSMGAPVTEYEMVLRLGEQYLIRAEAEANGAGVGVGAALADLDTIRNRAGLNDYAGATNSASVLDAIYHERQVELFTEWGHRWLDLKRTGMIDSVMSNAAPLKSNGVGWQSYLQWYPIVLSELQHNPNLVQNKGY